MKNLFLVVAIFLCLFTFDLFSWDSKEDFREPSTHTFISAQGHRILESELMGLTTSPVPPGILMGTLQETKSGELQSEFIHGSVAPDNEAKNYDFYQDHFWDPLCDENYTYINLENVDPKHYPTHSPIGDLFKALQPYVVDTAETRVRQYFAEAVYLWKTGNRARALYYLGMASHYLEDICCPVHSSNTIGIMDYGLHIEFEKYVEARKEMYAIPATGIKVGSPEQDPLDSSWYMKIIEGQYITDNLRGLNVACGTASKGIIDHYGAGWCPSVFDEAARPAMATAQKAESILIFAFMYAVNMIHPGEDLTRETIFTATISTKDGENYGTHNGVFWGIEFRDGRFFEQYCGIGFHRPGSTYRYDMKIKGEIGQNVRKVWVRKARVFQEIVTKVWLEQLFDDDWYPSSISLASSDNGVNFRGMVDGWIKGNKGVTFDVLEGIGPLPLKNHRESGIETTRRGGAFSSHEITSNVEGIPSSSVDAISTVSTTSRSTDEIKIDIPSAVEGPKAVVPSTGESLTTEKEGCVKSLLRKLCCCHS